MEHYKGYKHIRNTDVAFYPTRIEKQRNGNLQCGGWWINIVNPEAHFVISYELDAIEIQAEDVDKWKPIKLRWKR